MLIDISVWFLVRFKILTIKNEIQTKILKQDSKQKPYGGYKKIIRQFYNTL